MVPIVRLGTRITHLTLTQADFIGFVGPMAGPPKVIMRLLTLRLSKNPSHGRTGKVNVKRPCLSAWVVESAMLLCFAQHWVLKCPPHGSLTRSSHSPGPSPQLQVIWPILSGEGMAGRHEGSLDEINSAILPFPASSPTERKSKSLYPQLSDSQMLRRA